MDAPELPQGNPQDAERLDIEQNKDIAAFGYLWLMAFLVYFLRRNSPFVRFHAKQAIVLCIISIVVFFVPFINKLLELGVFLLMVMGFVSAAQGQKKDIPIIGPLSRREMSIREAWRQVVEYVGRLFASMRSAVKNEKPKDQNPSTEQTSPTP